MKKISEEMHLEKEWYKKAEKIKMGELDSFVNNLIGDYEHDYGTIVKAMCAGMMATMSAINKSSQGGITGFQAGCLMWEVIRQLNMMNNKCGMKLVDYDKMLYPQYKQSFEKEISLGVWENLQKEALANLNKNEEFVDEFVDAKVLEHWRGIVDGKVPFGYSVDVVD